MVKMSRSAVAVIASLAAIVVLAACGSGSAGSSANERKPATCVKVPASALAAKGEIRIGVNATLPPLAYQGADGKLQGERIELAAELARLTCLKVRWTNAVATTLLPSLNAKRIDIIDIGYFVTPERTKVMEMIPTEKMGVGVVVRNDDAKGVTSTKDLAGRKVATSVGSYEETTIKKINDDQVAHGAKKMTVQSFDNYDLVFQSLASKQVDAAVTTDPVAKYYADKGGFSLAVKGLSPTPTSLTVRGGNDALAKAVVEALDAMRKSGFYAALMKKYNLAPVDRFQVQWTG